MGCAVGGVNIALADGVRDQLPSIVSHVDVLYEENKWTEALEYLQQFNQLEEAEVLWRLARLCYKVLSYSRRTGIRLPALLKDVDHGGQYLSLQAADCFPLPAWLDVVEIIMYLKTCCHWIPWNNVPFRAFMCLLLQRPSV